MSDKQFVSIAGNIGVGKSTLTARLAERLKFKPSFEIVETNPYLQDFYVDMKRWSFQLQMFFLTQRYRHQGEILKTADSVLQDRSLYEDAEVFAKNLFMQGLMDERDYKTYREHYDLLASSIQAPGLMIYLRADVPTLQKRIALRGRDYERKISADYLKSLNGLYESWAADYTRSPILTIDASKLDFVSQPEALESIVGLVAWELDRLKNRSQTELPLAKKAKAKLGAKPAKSTRTRSEVIGHA